MHSQILNLVLAGQLQAQELIDVVREIQASVTHAQSIDADDALTTVQAELAAFAAWDQTGDVPTVAENGDLPVAVVNPLYQPEYLPKRTQQRDEETGEPVTDENGRIQYDILERYNEQYDASIPQYVFKSATGIEIDENGQIAGSGEGLEAQLTRLLVAEKLAEFLGTPVAEAGNKTIAELVESVTTVKSKQTRLR